MVPATADPEPAIDQPKFLNKDALRYPQTAIQALVNESKRLFEGPTYKIVAHALNLHRTDIASGIKPKKLIRSSTEVIDIDIDELYYTKVKSIYSSIIEFGTTTLTLFSLSPAKVEAINKLKLANRHVVQAIKDARELRDNVNRYMFSENEHIQKEYNNLRKKVVRVLREIHLTRVDTHPASHLKSLEKLKEKIRRSDVLVDGTLDELIRNQLITSEMATSLANDSNYVTGICNDLINATELLYIKSDTLLAGFQSEDSME